MPRPRKLTRRSRSTGKHSPTPRGPATCPCATPQPDNRKPDRKSTRLNSSHLGISYAVFCLKKKNNHTQPLDKASNLMYIYSSTSYRQLHSPPTHRSSDLLSFTSVVFFFFFFFFF